MVSGALSRLSDFKGKSAAMPCQLKRSISAFSAAIAVSLVTLPHEGARAESPGLLKTYDIAKDAYVYGFPMIAAYKAMYQFNIDKSSPQYKGPFNRVLSEGRVFTPKDTAIVTPNSDTPYSMVQMDLRVEPMVLCVPAIDKSRYYSVQLTDLYTFNYGYIGTRATGTDAGCYMVTGPGWKGETPPGIAKTFNSETDFSLAIFRTQLFNPADIDNVKKIQAQYKAQSLSQFFGRPAPRPLPTPFPKFTMDAFKTDAFSYLNFLMQFTPATGPAEVEKPLRARFAEIGISPGNPYNFSKLSLERRLLQGLGIKEGYKEIVQRRASIGRVVNGWRIAAAFGDRAFYDGDYALRAAAALAGIYGNDADEALYPLAVADNNGDRLDGKKHKYTITFPAGGLPPVNAFWSVTMYDGKTQLLIENPIKRYLINSPMLPDLKKNADGSVTIFVQKDTPGADKESNWLPAPNGPIYMVMRLYWPKQEAVNGSWKPPVISRVE
jgi:hypothetical protein